MTTPPPSWPEIVKKVEHGVVQIRTAVGSGSGFVVSDGGYVITNAHVVSDADNRVHHGAAVTVRFFGNVDVDGFVVSTGLGNKLDLACLQVVHQPFQVPLPLGNSDLVPVGAPVIAVGYPVPSQTRDTLTVTEGIISAKHPGELQTSADINPGNSGGPLIDRLGNVIGVNTKGVAWAGGLPVAGINFAIATNVVKQQFPFIVRAEPRPEPYPAAATPPETQRDSPLGHTIFDGKFSINLPAQWESLPGSAVNFARFQSDCSSLFLCLVDPESNLQAFALRNREGMQVRATTWNSGVVGNLAQSEHSGKRSFHFDYQGDYRDGKGVFKGRYDFSPLAYGGGRDYILFAGLVTWANSPDDKAGLRLVMDTLLSRMNPTQ